VTEREREINHNSDIGFYSLGSPKSEGEKKRRIRQTVKKRKKIDVG
jgi:hypothetical protein